jgi:hypothetical protein
MTSSYGAVCPKCREWLLAPERSEFIAADRIRHCWSCCRCAHRFETVLDLAAARAGAEFSLSPELVEEFFPSLLVA